MKYESSNYVLEYSNSQSSYHIDTKQKRIENECQIRSDYNVIFTGTYEECLAKYKELIYGDYNG